MNTEEISKIYDHQESEKKWYAYWIEQGFFHSEPDEREPYTMAMPPPNVTGVLHMGHVLNNTIQDVLVRHARMQGKNTCWVPGTDHASIATEAKVVAMLKEKGISKNDISREEFLKYAWDWKEKYGGIIIEQLKTLGCSCDWERIRFTMDKDLSDAVIHVFVDLYKKGYIYRGVRMVNWDPKGLTAVSDEEVNYKEVDSKLYYVRYKIVGAIHESPLQTDQWITIATTRPETILGDTAVCVHPNDERYKSLIGKHVIIPIANRSVPVIADEYITMEFGTGALKVTPAHDINDYNLGVKHNLPSIDTLNPDGTMSKEAGFYLGEDRFVVREKIVKDLDKLGQIVKVENIRNKVGYSERTDAVIEPKLSMQWFLKMDKISKPALDNVLNGTIKLIPDKYINTYRHWMENVHDWCISRQLWWGQQIPVWYCIDSTKAECREPIVSETNIEKCPHCGSKNIRQDEDVLDTWFSSWLWPISVFDGFSQRDPFGKTPGNKDINYYYPTNDLVTAPEILFFWVARMIIAGYEYLGKEPFSYVYLTGTVRDKIGRKMSKSLGNSPDPLDLIAKYGADGVRVGILLCSPAGNDLTFDELLCEQGRNFSNKLWNALRLVKGWEVNHDIAQNEINKIAIKWFRNKLNTEIHNIENLYSNYKISEILMVTYKLVWDDFCAWYLEMIKPPMPSSKEGIRYIDEETYQATIEIFEKLLQLLHPFMPFITEEIWQYIKVRKEKECVIVSQFPQPEIFNKLNKQYSHIPKYSYLDIQVDINTTYQKIFNDFERIKEGIKFIRTVRQQKFNNKEVTAICVSLYDEIPSIEIWHGIIEKLSGAKVDISQSAFTLTDYYLYPGGPMDWYVAKENAGSIKDFIKLNEEKIKLQQDLEYYKGFLRSVEAKLNNQKFVNNARPEVIQNEKNKKADAEAKISALEKQLGN